jgi:hypothetical protein
MKTLLHIAMLAAACSAMPASEGPFRHPDELYPALDLSWRSLPGAGICEQLWPHPLLPGVVMAGGEKGLRLSRDAGLTWAAPRGLPSGAVLSLAWHPGLVDVAIAATSQGLWRSQDGGTSFTALPAPQLPEPTGVWFLPRDALTRSILVAHGEGSTGLSISSDDGATWRQVLTEYHVHRVFIGAMGSQALTIIASLPEDPVRSLFCLPSPNEKPVEVQRDCAITDAAVPPHVGPLHLVSPRDGLMHLESRDNGFQEAIPVPTGQDAPNGFSAIAMCWGAHVDRQLLFTFDPFGLGATYSTDNTTWTAARRGLPTGDMVKEGAQFCCNANGSRFYAVINDRVYIGLPTDLRLDGAAMEVIPALAVVQADRYSDAIGDLTSGLPVFNTATDPLAAARVLRATLDQLDAAVQPAAVRLRVRMAADAVPQRLTVDLSRFGQSSSEPLYDDGKHGDDDAGDGLWTTDVAIRPNHLSPERNDWRRTPGVLGLSVSAYWPDGQRSGAVAPLAVWSMVESLDLFRERKAEKELAKVVITEGLAKEVSVDGDGAVVTLTAAGGPWQATIRLDFYWRSCLDVAPYAGLTLDWLGAPASLHLVDKPLYEEPSHSATVQLAPGGLLAAADAEGWAVARIPFSRLITDDSTFDRNRVVALVLSGDAKAGETFSIRSPRVLSATDWGGP